MIGATQAPLGLPGGALPRDLRVEGGKLLVLVDPDAVHGPTGRILKVPAAAPAQR